MISVHHLQNSHSELQTPTVKRFVRIHTFLMPSLYRQVVVLTSYAILLFHMPLTLQLNRVYTLL